MSQSRIKVATVTANYNNGKYFGECLDGIIKQTYKPTIAIVVDDGSTDDSLSLIKTAIYNRGARFISSDGSSTHEHYNASLNGIEIVVLPCRENKGPAAARNVAVQYAASRGIDAFCVADSDDVLYPPKIEKSVEIMLKYPQVALVYSDYDIYNEAEQTLKREFKEPFNHRRLFEECIVSNNSVVAISVLKDIGLYDESLFGPEDYDLWMRIAEVAAVYHIPEALYKYRISGNNITITTPSERFAEHVRRVKMKAMERMNGKR